MPKNIALKIAILHSGLSQIEVATLIGVDEAIISKFVNGHRTPTEEQLKALARVLKRKPEQLFPEAVAS
jgi:transcriptional regulator with XRE-family HTH domain